MYLAKKNAFNQEYVVMGAAAFTGLVLIAVFYYMVLIPAVRELSLVNSKINIGRKTSLDPSGYRAQYAELEAQIEGMGRQIAKNKERLFWKKDIAFFMERLSRIAGQIPVDFISIRPSPAAEAITADNKEKTVLMYRHFVAITMRVSYRGLIDFLARIEDSDRFFKIDELTIEPDAKDILKRNIAIALSIFSAD